MSYSFTVIPGSNGEPQITNFSGSLPGTLAVNGHEDEHSVSLGVTRLTETGACVIQANAYKSATKE